jgi:hypothetical protein
MDLVGPKPFDCITDELTYHGLYSQFLLVNHIDRSSDELGRKAYVCFWLSSYQWAYKSANVGTRSSLVDSSLGGSVA